MAEVARGDWNSGWYGAGRDRLTDLKIGLDSNPPQPQFWPREIRHEQQGPDPVMLDATALSLSARYQLIG